MVRVIVIGAGIGGLAVALGLARAGLDVVVYERATALEEVGAGIQLAPNAGRILDGWGLAAKLAAVENRPARIELRLSRSGGLLAQVPLGAEAERRFGAPYRTIHRADLVAVLARALEDAAPGALRLGAQLAHVEQTPHGVTAHFAGGAFETADALIAADGLRSGVQAHVTRMRAGAPRHTGSVAWRGTVPTDSLPAALRADVVTAAFGPQRHFVCYPIRGGTLMNFVAVGDNADWMSEAWSAPGDPQTLRAAFADWAAPAAVILDAVEHTTLWAIYDRAPLPAWTRDRVALLGDAAHPMAPFLAQGAGQALEDADDLISRLSTATPDSVPAALKAYEKARKPRATRVQKAARRQGALYHRTGALSQFVSYAPLWLGSRVWPSAGLWRYGWLFGGGR